MLEMGQGVCRQTRLNHAGSFLPGPVDISIFQPLFHRRFQFIDLKGVQSAAATIARVTLLKAPFERSPVI